MIGRYEQICTNYAEEFERNRRLHGEAIHCRAGCSDCCHQLFQITEIEAAIVSRGAAQLPDHLRAEAARRAASYLTSREKITATAGEPEAWGSLPPPGARLPCPALQDGTCLIYDYRPLICRKFGMPLWNPDRPGRVYACELNFQPGQEILDPQLIRIQSALHQDWKALQACYNQRGGKRDNRPITVARALIEDFSGYPPPP
jgi:Fe-S-cluster containining protein